MSTPRSDQRRQTNGALWSAGASDHGHPKRLPQGATPTTIVARATSAASRQAGADRAAPRPRTAPETAAARRRGARQPYARHRAQPTPAIASRRLSARSSRASRNRPQPMLSEPRTRAAARRLSRPASPATFTHATTASRSTRPTITTRTEIITRICLIGAAEHETQASGTETFAPGRSRGSRPDTPSEGLWVARSPRAKLRHALSWLEHAKDSYRVAAIGGGSPCRGPGWKVQRRGNSQSPDRTKPARQDADDGVRMAREHERAPDDVWVASELPIPERMRHDHGVACRSRW